MCMVHTYVPLIPKCSLIDCLRSSSSNGIAFHGWVPKYSANASSSTHTTQTRRQHTPNHNTFNNTHKPHTQSTHTHTHTQTHTTQIDTWTTHDTTHHLTTHDRKKRQHYML